MLRYFVAFKSTAPAEKPPPALLDAVMELGDEATKAGVLLDTGGLYPSHMGGIRVSLSAGEVTVAEGPFPDPTELISYAIYQVEDKAEAVEWAERFLTLYRDLWPGWEGEVDLLEVLGL